MTKAKAVSNFLPHHATTYGLRISARNPTTTRVTSVVCRFCAVFGREEKVGGKRARTENVKYFTTFRSDSYRRHLNTSQGEHRAQYQKIWKDKDKEQFFKSVSVAFVNTLDAHLDAQPNQQRVLINAPIVEIVIGDLLLHPDDVESVTRDRALRQFKRLEEAGEADERQCDLYEVVIKTPRQFRLCIDFVSCGASFCMASRLMDCTRAESGIAAYGGCSDVVASDYTRFVCANALQILSDWLRQV